MTGPAADVFWLILGIAALTVTALMALMPSPRKACPVRVAPIRAYQPYVQLALQVLLALAFGAMVLAVGVYSR